MKESLQISGFATVKRILICILFSLCSLGCKKVLNLKSPAVTPRAVFDDLWTALDRNYALYSIKNINWDSVYKVNSIQFDDSLNDAELFNKLALTLESLKDGHISLIAPFKTYSYDKFYTLYPKNYNWTNIEKNYLKNIYKTSGPLIYKVTDSVGYLHYNSFRNNISDDELNIAINELISTKGLIIDVRNNTGGNLINVEKLFSHFVKSTQLVKYEVFKNGYGHNDFKEKVPFYVNPQDGYYGKPVALLTNRSCFSACNDFALYMAQLNNVTVIGDYTGGGGAIPANYILINGWKLQYGASLTLSPSLVPAEYGIAPDVPVNINPIQDANGIDPILEKAYQLLR